MKTSPGSIGKGEPIGLHAVASVLRTKFYKLGRQCGNKGTYN